jgi:hypothetical protein
LTYKQFPLHLWDRLISHAIVTLNLLQQSKVNPKLLAYSQFNSPLNFNRTPITPPGSRVIFQKKPRQRKTWVPHRVDGFYVGPTMYHCRFHRVYCSATGQEQIVDTIELMPQHCKVPGLSSADAATIAATNLTHTLLHPAPTTPFKQLGS